MFKESSPKLFWAIKRPRGATPLLYQDIQNIYRIKIKKGGDNMAEEKKVQESEPGYNKGILVGLLIGIALFMLTYQLLLMSK